jgi:hypothetical protein
MCGPQQRWRRQQRRRQQQWQQQQQQQQQQVELSGLGVIVFKRGPSSIGMSAGVTALM